MFIFRVAAAKLVILSLALAPATYGRDTHSKRIYRTGSDSDRTLPELMSGWLSAVAIAPGSVNLIQKESMMSKHATGTFEVKLTPQDDKFEDKTLGRMTIEKQWHGGLEGSSKGQMLTAGSGVKSGGYVAIEKFTGTLDGKRGSFVFQHSGTMTRGAPQLSITVVPDSGTDQFEGLTGRLTIKIENGKHSYAFEYAFAKAP